MQIEQLLEQYGYWAVFLGVCLEGPLTLSAAGFLAHQQYLNVAGVFATAFAATFLKFQAYYFIGLWAGRYMLAHWEFWRQRYARLSTVLERYKGLFILGFRFVYGAQTAGCIAAGMVKIRPAYFSIMNAVGAAIWTLAFLLVGYFAGQAFELLIADIKKHETPILLIILAVIAIYYLASRLAWRRVDRDKNDDSE